MSLLKRYESALSSISTAELLALPDDVKERLKKATDLETKVVILESLVSKKAII